MKVLKVLKDIFIKMKKIVKENKLKLIERFEERAHKIFFDFLIEILHKV